MSEDIKEFVIAGYKVTLHFRRSSIGSWMVKGTVSAGEQDHKRTTPFEIEGAASRDVAETLALGKAGELMGNNVPAVDGQDPVSSTSKVPPDIH